MDREDWFRGKWLWLRRFAVVAAAGGLLGVLGIAFELPALGVLVVLLLMPILFWLAVIPVLHWKDRYIGDRSGLWGVCLAVELSGWSKLVYWFRHILPDRAAAGRYRDLQ